MERKSRSILKDEKTKIATQRVLTLAQAWLEKMAGYTIFSVPSKKQRTKVIINGKEEIECKEREVSILIVGDYMVDAERNLIYGNEKLEEVKPELMCLLEYFIHHQGKVISKEMLSVEVWENEKLFFRVVKTAFNQRRKMLRSSLKSFNLSNSLKEDPIFAKRPEQLSVAAFISLTQKLADNGI